LKGYFKVSEPKVIYLGPACEADTSDGRTWAEDNPWPDCECGHRPVQYVLGETFDRVVAERDALQLRLDATDQRIDSAEELLRRSHAVVDGTGWTDLERDIVAFFKPAEGERDHQIPGTSGMRLNMLANQGE
jgi:hypothetical protein